MLQQIVQHEDGQAVVLSKEHLDELRVDAGDWVEVERSNGSIVIRRVEMVPHLSDDDRQFLKELYKRRRRVFEALAE